MKQAQRKPKLLLASVLKPIDDSRMYGKFAKTLCEEFEVHVAGFEAAKPPKQQGGCAVTFHPLYSFQRLGTSRWLSGKKLLRLLSAIQPDILCIHAVELLPFGCFYCIKHRIPLVYDIQENYAKNFWHQKVYSKAIKPMLSVGVRLMEWLCSPFVDFFILAEQSYAEELPFTAGKRAIIENKAIIEANASHRRTFPRTIGQDPTQAIRITYTGTISEAYGIRRAVWWCSQMQTLRPIVLEVVGYSSEPALREWLIEQKDRLPWLRLEGIDSLVPHERIIEALRKCDFAILPYQPNPSTSSCYPTKLYECLALGVPMLLPKNPLWEQRASKAQGGVSIDFDSPPSIDILQKLENAHFYEAGADRSALWSKEPLLEVFRLL